MHNATKGLTLIEILISCGCLMFMALMLIHANLILAQSQRHIAVLEQSLQEVSH